MINLIAKYADKKGIIKQDEWTKNDCC
jgi:hypothetical protein